MSYTDFVTKAWKLDPAVLAPLPDPHLRPVRLRGRRRAGAGRLGARPARLPGHEPRARQRPRAEPRLDPHRRRRGLLLPLPRRQRHHRPAAGAPARARGGARQLDRRRRGARRGSTTPGSTTRRRRRAFASTARWCGWRTTARRGRNRRDGDLPARRPARTGARRGLRPRLLAPRHPAHLSRAARGAAGRRCATR